MNIDLMGAGLATLAAFFVSMNVYFIRKATVTGNPLDAVITTLWINALVFSIGAIIFNYRDFQINIVTILIFASSGLLGPFIGRILYFSGIKKIGASRTSPIARGSLLVATVFGVFILNESITIGHTFGIFFIFIGVAMVSYEIQRQKSLKNQISILDKDSLKSLLYPIGAMFFIGIAHPIAKIGLSTNVPVLVALSVRYISAFLAISGYYVYQRKSITDTLRVKESKNYILAGLLLSIGVGIFYYSLNISRVVVAMPFYSLAPLFVIIISYLFLKKLEKVTKILVLGALMVVGGGMLIGLFM
jgi:drug/metabolite transporter (DMT)-like permease